MSKVLLRLGKASIERTVVKQSLDSKRAIIAHRLFNQRNLTTETTKQDKDKEDMDQFKNNPYFEKYKNKLKAVYDEDPEKFDELLKNKKIEKVGNPEDYGIDLSEPKSRMASAVTKKRTLDSLMNLEKVKDLEPEAIKAIWITFLSEIHKYPGMITADEYYLIADRSKEFPSFIYPLPREEGYEFILGQWSGPECHFTPLINYQAHGENAPSVMTVVYFDELLDSKKISLEMSEVDSRHLKMEEAKFLIQLTKDYYIGARDGDDKHTLLTKFNREPHLFSHMDVIEELKKTNFSPEQFKEIINIEDATKGILERVTPPPQVDEKPQAKSEKPASNWVRQEIKKEKDLADFS